MKNYYSLHTDKLKDSYKDTFKDIETYVTSLYISDSSKEDMLSNVLDLLLNAQENGQPVEKVVGKNIQAFCKDYCSGNTFKETLTALFDEIKFLVWWMFINSILDTFIYVAELMEGNKISFFKYTSENFFGVALLVMTLTSAVSILTGYPIRKLMFKIKKPVKNLLLTVRFILIFIPCTIFVIYYEDLKGITLPIWIPLFASLAFIIPHHILTKERREMEKKTKVSFSEQMAESSVDAMKMVQYESFDKYNKKLIKKGKSPIEYKEYINLNLKEAKKTLVFFRNPVLTNIIVFALIAVFVFISYHANMYESVWDAVSFYIVVCVIEFFLMKFLYKLATAEHNAIIDYYEDEIDYLESGSDETNEDEETYSNKETSESVNETETTDYNQDIN